MVDQDTKYPQTTAYERHHKIINEILQGGILESKPNISPFSKDTKALENLLAKSKHIPMWIIFYGNKCLSLDELADLT